jgi:hypothetical protein
MRAEIRSAAAPAGWGPRTAARLRRLRPIHAVPVLAAIALAAWAFSSPIGSSPDDDFHLTSIWCGNPLDTAACEPGTEPGTRVVPEAVVEAPSCYAQRPEISASCQADTFDLDPTPSVETDRGNFEHNYPPVYYAVMSVLVGPGIEQSILLMRLLNVVLFVGLTTALFCLLPRTRRPALAWGWLIVSVPLGMFLLASNNPSAWALIGVGSSWLALLGFFETTGRTRVALGALFVVTALMASGARGDAALYTIMGSALAIFLAARRDRGFLLSTILPAAMAVVSLIFFLTSQQSAVVSSGLGGSTGVSGAPLGGDGGHKSGFTLLAYNLLMVPSLWTGVFGDWGLGWLDTGVPAVVRVGAAGIFAAVVFANLRRIDLRKGIAVLGVGLVLWLLPTFILVRGGNEVGENVQPRYILPIMVVLAILACLPVLGRGFRPSWLQVGLVGGTLLVAEAFSLHANIRRYVTGDDVQGWNLDAGAEWWWHIPFSPMAVWGIGVLAYAGVLVILGREVVKRDVLR